MAMQLPPGTFYLLLDNLPVYLGHLVHVELAGQHHHIGKLGIEPERLDVADVELGGEMHLLPHTAAVGHHGHIGGDDGGDAGLVGGIHDGVHGSDVLTIDDGVHGEVGLDVVATACLSDEPQVVDGEGVGRVGTHIELADTEVYTVGTCLDGGLQTLVRAYGCHDLIIGNVFLHGLQR